MRSADDSSSSAFFDAKYRTDDDPWRFAEDEYELGRYRNILDHVDPARHRVVYEPGCSIGVLTEMLGERCATVDATDLSEVAVDRARLRCAHLPGVTITVGDLAALPRGAYDLVVFSEVGYYQSLVRLERFVVELAASITPAGRLIAAHWIGSSPDHRLHGHQVHDLLTRTLRGWTLRHHQVHLDDHHDGYRLDVWDRP